MSFSCKRTRNFPAWDFHRILASVSEAALLITTGNSFSFSEPPCTVSHFPTWIASRNVPSGNYEYLRWPQQVLRPSKCIVFSSLLLSRCNDRESQDLQSDGTCFCVQSWLQQFQKRKIQRKLTQTSQPVFAAVSAACFRVALTCCVCAAHRTQYGLLWMQVFVLVSRTTCFGEVTHSAAEGAQGSNTYWRMPFLEFILYKSFTSGTTFSLNTAGRVLL